jgi:hypothetical protein
MKQQTSGTARIINRRYTIVDMHNALTSIQKNQISKYKAAKLYNIPYSTLNSNYKKLLNQPEHLNQIKNKISKEINIKIEKETCDIIPCDIVKTELLEEEDVCGIIEHDQIKTEIIEEEISSVIISYDQIKTNSHEIVNNTYYKNIEEIKNKEIEIYNCIKKIDEDIDTAKYNKSALTRKILLLCLERGALIKF